MKIIINETQLSILLQSNPTLSYSGTKSIRKIIEEAYFEMLLEDDDYNYEYFDREDEVKQWVFDTFLYKNNPDFTMTIPWKLVPFLRLKKIWEDYIRHGIVRDTKGLVMIKDIMISNALKIYVITYLLGHTSDNPDDDYEENIGHWLDEQLNCIIRNEPEDENQLELPFDNPETGYVEKDLSNNSYNTEVNPYIQELVDTLSEEDLSYDELRKKIYDELMEKFSWYYTEDPKSGQAYISDYGLNPLRNLSHELSKTEDPKQIVIIIDKMLNVVHQRSDIASWFIQGGSKSLNQLSGYEDDEGESKISGKYRMTDYL